MGSSCRVIKSSWEPGQEYSLFNSANIDVNILCRSPVFNAMFIHNMTEAQEKIIDIEDLDIETVRDMLKYMYAGKIENLNTRSPRLLEAADKYQLSELKEICEETLCDNLTVDSCLECLVLADLHTAEDLKQAAIKFVVDHSEDFVDQVLSWATVVKLRADLIPSG